MTRENVERLHKLPRHAASDRTGWAERHARAVAMPKAGFEAALLSLFRGWLMYADAHAECYGTPIGDDGVLGPCWAQMGAGLRGLLNGELQRFDGGTLDGVILDALSAQGYDPDTL